MKFKQAGMAGLSLFLLATSLARAQERAAGNPSALQLPGKPSMTTAHVPEDHVGLAAYFRDLASQEESLAKSYERMAKLYREKVLPPGLDRAAAREIKDEYKRLAEMEKRAAAAAATIAAYHTRLAELMAHSPVAAEHTTLGDLSAFRR